MAYTPSIDDINGYLTTIPRQVGASATILKSGILNLSYFTPHKTLTVSKVTTFTAAPAAGATPTLCRIGVYGMDSSNNLTLIGSMANDTTMWAGTYSTYTKNLSASVTLSTGTRYAVGALIVTSAAEPGLNSSFNIPLGNTTPRLVGSLSSQTDLPTSISAASVVAYYGNMILCGLSV